MDTRRSFIKKSALLSGAAGIWSALPASIQKALAIDPAAGSTFYDAEHIVFLMQENRSFDHAFGTLQGVRGFNDPRAILLPDKNPVWLQTNKEGETYAPFRLNIKDTKITWMGCLPHSWDNQTDARHDGKFDKWLDTKHSGQEEFDKMPLTMGYYNREDIPFYYSLADAFTVCDQHFCSSLTGTTPNRLHFWSGTIRSEQAAMARACVWNGDADFETAVGWKTYPERLEENGISWKVYQNEINVGTGLSDEEDGWLSNFGDNPLEYFTQFKVRFAPEYIADLPRREASLKKEIGALETQLSGQKTEKQATDWTKQLARKKAALEEVLKHQKIYTKENFDKLSEHEKNIHEKSFSNNRTDPHYHTLTELDYQDGAIPRALKIPKGDILKQFRDDVNDHKLPVVSWLVAPQYFSDHPDSPWFGAWYVSEVMDILTKDPEVWKKTIFILTYDENDGYYDHVPPFVAPDPYKEHTGKVSEGIDATLEFVKHDQQAPADDHMREGAIGLGFRVPMVVASPWTRGGWVCSEIFDHTSSLQFLEKFLEKKTGKKIVESNVNAWRRTVCGDLESVFRPYNNESIKLPEFLEREKFIESIYTAKFKKEPSDFRKLSKTEIERIGKTGQLSGLLPVQEKGIRSACALPYELYVDGHLDKKTNIFSVQFKAAQDAFGRSAIGSPFYVYAMSPYERQLHRTWNYAVKAGHEEQDEWALDNFDSKSYHLRVYGPNGFFREFSGGGKEPALQVNCQYEWKGKKLTGNVSVVLVNTNTRALDIVITDNYYKAPAIHKKLVAGEKTVIILNQAKSFGWYDFSVSSSSDPLSFKRFAGHVETGGPSKTDPLMGGVV